VGKLYIEELDIASSHQIHAAHFSSRKEASGWGMQKCGRAVAPRDQKRGVCERFFFTCIRMLYGKACMCALLKIGARY